MNKEEAAKELGISVRSFQRLVSDGKFTRTLRRGDSGKQQAFFDAEEIENFKQQRDVESVKPATVTTGDTALARNDVGAFFEMLKSAVAPQRESVSVGIADKPLLKLDEAAALTGLSRQILRKAIDEEALKAKIIGRAYRVKRVDLDEFVNNL